MPRKNLIRSKIYPYHVTNRVNNREWFHANMELVWKLFCDELAYLTVVYRVKIHSFVLLSNHFHLLISTPEEDLGIVMQVFLSSITKAYNRLSCREDHLFGGRYHWTIIQMHKYYENVVRYIYLNPIRAKIVTDVGDYKFSSFRFLIGSERPEFQLTRPVLEEIGMTSPDCPFQLYLSLKLFQTEGELNAVRAALRKKIFKYPIDRKTRKEYDASLNQK